jgi:hypothetical protein
VCVLVPDVASILLSGAFALHLSIRYLSQEDKAPHAKTIERWCTREKWVEPRAKDLSDLAERAEIQIREGLSLRNAGRYRQVEKHFEDLSKRLDLYQNVPEFFDEEAGKWVERENPYEVETRPRLPIEFGRRAGNVYTEANLERVVSSLERAAVVLARMLPQKIAEPEEEKTTSISWSG